MNNQQTENKMNQSEQINELASALALAQGEMQNAKKDVSNPFYKSKYADLASVMDTARPVLSKNGLSVAQLTEMTESGVILVTQLLHKSGQWLRASYPVKPLKDDPQGMGSALTYARRYSYGAIVGIATEEDDDGNAASGKQDNQKPTAKSVYGTQTDMKKRFKEIKDAILETGTHAELDAVTAKYKADFVSMKAIDETFFDDLKKIGEERRKAIALASQQRADLDGWPTDEPLEEDESACSKALSLPEGQSIPTFLAGSR